MPGPHQLATSRLSRLALTSGRMVEEQKCRTAPRRRPTTAPRSRTALGGAETVETGCEQGADAGRNWLRRPPEVAQVQAWVNRYERNPAPISSLGDGSGGDAGEVRGARVVLSTEGDPEGRGRHRVFAEGEPGTDVLASSRARWSGGSGGLDQHLGSATSSGRWRSSTNQPGAPRRWRCPARPWRRSTVIASCSLEETPTFALDVMSVMAERSARSKLTISPVRP